MHNSACATASVIHKSCVWPPLRMAKSLQSITPSAPHGASLLSGSDVLLHNQCGCQGKVMSCSTERRPLRISCRAITAGLVHALPFVDAKSPLMPRPLHTWDRME